MKVFYHAWFSGKIHLWVQFISLFFIFSSFSCGHAPEPIRIVAVGDVHGTYKEFTDILQKAELIDQNQNWIGEKTILVQTGDIMDRGPEVRKVMEFLMALEKQAARKGGQVITLMGNHEAYNIMGYFDDQTTPLPIFNRICESFADAKSQQHLVQFRQQYDEWKNRYPRCAMENPSQGMDIQTLGCINYLNAISSTGKYGRWLRSCPVTVRLDNTLFMHGGISPELIRLHYTTSDRINRTLKTLIDRFDRLKQDLIEKGEILPFSTLEEIECVVDQMVQKTQIDSSSEESIKNMAEPDRMQKILHDASTWMLSSSDSPLLFRGYATWAEKEGQAIADEIIKIWDIEHIVVGHTPSQNGEIRSRFNNRIFLIDTGMVFGLYPGINGQPSALEIKNGEFTAIYRDRVVPLTGNERTE